MQVGLGPGHIALDGDPALPPPNGGRDPQFLAYVCCCQMAAGIKTPLGMDVGLGPGDCVRRGPRSPPQKSGRSPQIFGPCLLWPNGWMDRDRSWHRSRPHPRRLYVRWRPCPLTKKGAEPPPQFSAHFYCGQTAGCIKMPLAIEEGLSPVDFVLDGDPAPSPKWAHAHVSNGCMDQDATWYGGRPQPRLLCVT